MLLKFLPKKCLSFFRSNDFLSIKEVSSFCDSLIVSEKGFQQGDPRAVFLFCLSIHKLIVKLKARLRMTYIANMTKGDDWKTVLEDLRLVIDENETVVFERRKM